MSNRLQPNYKYSQRENGSRRMQLTNYGPSRVQQHQKDQCDINMIIKKFRQTGKLPLNQQTPIYDDFSNAIDYKQACNLVAVAEQQFAMLPADIRKRFGNSPEAFLDFATNEDNLEEMVKLGLKDKSLLPSNPVEETELNTPKEKTTKKADEVNNA